MPVLPPALQGKCEAKPSGLLVPAGSRNASERAGGQAPTGLGAGGLGRPSPASRCRGPTVSCVSGTRSFSSEEGSRTLSSLQPHVSLLPGKREEQGLFNPVIFKGLFNPHA